MHELLDGESVEIQGSAAKPYVLKNVGGVFSCSCQAWRNQSLPIERRTCKHLRHYLGEAAEQQRLGSLSTPCRRADNTDKTAKSAPGLLLAQNWSGDVDLADWWLSEKLDGVRAYWDGRRFLSRRGNRFHAPEWFVQGLPSQPLDGELWIDRKRFQRTVSIVRRQDQTELWREVSYLVFDAPGVQAPFEDRLAFVREALTQKRPPFARLIEQQRYLLAGLAKNAAFESWPLAEIISSRESFFRFLQDEWKTFLAAQADPSISCRVPFGHEDVRAYIDTFFLEGSLTPIEQDNAAKLPAWAQTGINHDPKGDALRRFRGLSQKFEAELPTADVSHRDWQQAAQRWAELVVLRWECDDSLEDADRNAWLELQATVEDAFGKWMMNRYGSLHNLPYHNQPVMVHQISRFVAVEKTRKKLEKIALLVLDGLALDQWLLLRKNLETFDKSLRFQESTAFAWVPTLTSVTRQSIFAAEPPLYFPDSLATTSKERSHWLRFWEDQGIQRPCIELVTNIQGPNDPDLEMVLGNARLSVLGIVWNKVDNIMHGMQMQNRDKRREFIAVH